MSLTSCASYNNPNDPYEGYNRVMFKVNDTLDTTILVPTARGYQKVVPKPVRAGVNNFFDNLRDVVSFGSNVLRLDIEKAATDISRVGINTSFGLGGLINIADLAEMPNNKNTLGDTFASWGWKNSNYFVFPLSGPSTVRDSVGSLAVSAASPERALFHNDKVFSGTSVLRAVNARSQYLGLSDALQDAAPDKYAYTRDLYMGMRARQTGGTYGQNTIDEDDIDSLVTPEGLDPDDIDDLVEPQQAVSSAQKAAEKEHNPQERGMVAPTIELIPINPVKM
ncbi:MAG: VacJ family lipoprotein [Neisseria sp.]|nr:VacJ family lipoprotein [Neisseria sp.]